MVLMFTTYNISFMVAFTTFNLGQDRYWITARNNKVGAYTFFECLNIHAININFFLINNLLSIRQFFFIDVQFIIKNREIHFFLLTSNSAYLEWTTLYSTFIINFPHRCFMCSDVFSRSSIQITEECDMNTH